ncbi:MAG: type 2 lantipeptide synthetase LanM [Tatlockia sp.]|nr:type 2 lantipeptide synthetase LanM [Tatlockia sp.]
MTVTQSDIAQIVIQASFLSERLSNGHIEVGSAQVNKQEANIRLAHWCQVVAQGNWEKFQKWLQWNGWGIEMVRPALGALSLVDSQALPTWAETVGAIIQTTSPAKSKEYEMLSVQNSSSSFNCTLTKHCIDPENPQPFEDVLLPVMQVARRKLLTRLGSASLSPDDLPLELLSETAYLSLERTLLQRLLNLCAKTLVFEFSRFRPLGHSLLNLLIGETKGTPKKVYYNAFVQKLLSDGLLAFFQSYPVLARLIAIAIDFWVEATAEFLQSLKFDLAEVQQVFDRVKQPEHEKVVSNIQLGKVLEINSSLSDPHNQGRSVIVCTFESGLKLAYKPKDLGLEVAYSQFLDWCNQQGIPLPFKVLKVVNRGTYGWVEYVEQQPCEDEAAAQRFYQRAGMLLCLLYALAGTDCHYENLIANGEHLVLVDMEALMHPEASLMADSAEETAAQTVAKQQFEDSVLSTGMLPFWAFSEDNGIAYDFSGLGSIDPQQSPKRLPVWKSINTDDMHLGYETMMLPVQANVPILHGVALSPNNYLEELVTGFRRMYRFLSRQRKVLLAADSPLEAFQAQQVRFLFRPTRVYGIVLQKTTAPEFLRNGVDWSIELDILSRAFLANCEKPNAWPILQAELRAMEQLDIPYFGASTTSDALTIGLVQPIEKYFKAPSYSQVLTKLQKLDETDLAQQVAILKLAFYARVAQTLGTEQGSSVTLVSHLREPGSQGGSPLHLLTSEQLLQQAQAIATEIQTRAITGSDGSVTWIGFGYVSSAERFQLQPLGDSLYDGNCGIGLFLAALDQVTGSTQFRDLALGCLQSLRKVLQTSEPDSAQRFVRAMGIGGATGLGSIIYSLVRISQFLQLPALIEDAQRAANLMTSEVIAADRQFDVMGGGAGAILGLLALYQETGSPAVLDRAIACGQHLLEHSCSVDSLRTWKNFGAKPLTGFSHGAAGIAYSLLQLYAVTQDSTYLDAACASIAYERSVFSPAAANWPDFRSFTAQSEQPVFLSSWCHGASGIGLGRLGSLSIYQTEEILADVAVALQTTQKYSLQGVDHLCCGNLGRCEVLLVAAQKLSCPQLLKTAKQEASMVVQRAEQTGMYQLFGNLPNSVFSPSFFQGTAGIGYQLLRLAYPESLPSVLLWE